MVRKKKLSSDSCNSRGRSFFIIFFSPLWDASRPTSYSTFRPSYIMHQNETRDVPSFVLGYCLYVFILCSRTLDMRHSPGGGAFGRTERAPAVVRHGLVAVPVEKLAGELRGPKATQRTRPRHLLLFPRLLSRRAAERASRGPRVHRDEILPEHASEPGAQALGRRHADGVQRFQARQTGHSRLRQQWQALLGSTDGGRTSGNRQYLTAA